MDGKMWDGNKFIDPPQEIVQFLDDIETVYKKHNISISHEDSQGAFVLERYSAYNMDWLREAIISLEN